MKIIVLNGSPRPNGHTAQMVASFKEGAESAGHTVDVVNAYQTNIKGCLGCNYCMDHDFICIQDDDMQKLSLLLLGADMLVLASPVYYFNFTGPLWNIISRFYPIGMGKVGKIDKAAMFLSSASPGVYDGMKTIYKESFVDYLKMQDMGIFTATEEDEEHETLYAQLKEFGAGLK